MSDRLKVAYERWDDGWWIARVSAVRGVHANGRTIEEARRRVREALAVASDEGWNEKRAAVAELVDEIRLSSEVTRALQARAKALESLQTAADAVDQTTRRAVAALVNGMGVGYRDAAALLELSHQRVHQLANLTASAELVGERPAAYRVRRDRRSASARRRKR